ncbi:unnamed protein product [Rotaria magnacalcarata]|nr:unnamed protein product [Rotaria magnacalcarata]
MPYAYLSNPTLCFDAWVIRKLATDDFSRDRWSLQDTVDYKLQRSLQHLGASDEHKKWEIIHVEEPDQPAEVSHHTEVGTDSNKK